MLKIWIEEENREGDSVKVAGSEVEIVTNNIPRAITEAEAELIDDTDGIFRRLNWEIIED